MLSLLPGILALLELKSTDAFQNGSAKCEAQAQAECIAINHLSPLPYAVDMTVPVILSDTKTTLLYQVVEQRQYEKKQPRTLLVCTVLNEANTAAAHIRQMLSGKLATCQQRADDILDEPGWPFNSCPSK